MYYLPNIIRVIKSGIMSQTGHGACMGERRGSYRVLVGKTEGRRPLRRPRHIWEVNIKKDLQEVVEGLDWTDLAQNRDR